MTPPAEDEICTGMDVPLAGSWGPEEVAFWSGSPWYEPWRDVAAFFREDAAISRRHFTAAVPVAILVGCAPSPSPGPAPAPTPAAVSLAMARAYRRWGCGGAGEGIEIPMTYAVTVKMTSLGLAVLKAELGDDYSRFPMAHQVLSRVFRAMVSASPDFSAAKSAIDQCDQNPS